MISLANLAAAALAADETHEAAKTGLFADTAFWVMLAFILVIIGFARLGVHKQISGGLDKRAQAIADELDAARRMREEAQELLSQYQRQQRNAEAEAAAIVEQAKIDAKRFAQESHDKINEQLERRTAAVEAKIARAEAQALADVRGQTADLAIAAASHIIRERMDTNAHSATIDRAIANIRNDLN